MFSLDGKVALVTGAGPNNGRSIALALADGGAAVAVSDLRPDTAAAVRDELVQGAVASTAVPFDVTDRDAVVAGVAQVERELGPIDILVNNAGTLSPDAIAGTGKTGGMMGQFMDSDPGEWRRWIDLNIYGSLHCIHAVLRGMTERGWGRVVQISSGAGSRGMPTGHSTYGAGKAGIEAAVRHIAVEVALTGVTLNSLALGSIGGVERASNPQVEALRSNIPVGRQGTPDEVAAAVRWLASTEAAYVTGQTIHVNGGRVFGR